MAPTIETKIWLALRSRIDTLNAGNLLWPGPWPVAFPGSDYEPRVGVPYVAVGRTTATPIRLEINRRVNDRAGILTISAVMPLGLDPAVYEEAGGLIAQHFGPCIVFGGVTLTLMSATGNVAHVVDGYRDGGWWRVPVNIPWRTWA